MGIITQEVEVKTMFVRLICAKCKVEMPTNAGVLTTYPMQYRYECPTCLDTYTSTKVYPYTYYKEITSEEK